MKIHNKSNKPDNILHNEQLLLDKAIELQNQLPTYMRDYFIYLKTSVSITTRIAYLNDIIFFLNYLILDDSSIKDLKGIPIEKIDSFTAQDFNYFIAEYCSRYEVYNKGQRIIYENNNTTLSRKKSSIMSLLKFMYRNGQIKNNISDGLNPIKLPKKSPDSIK